MVRKSLLVVVTVLYITVLVACGASDEENEAKEAENEETNNEAEESADANEDKPWYEQKGETEEDNIRYNIAQTIIDEMGLETNISADILEEDSLDDVIREDGVKNDSLIRFSDSYDSVEVRLEETPEQDREDEIMFVDLDLHIDLDETYDETNLGLLNYTQKIVDYLYQDIFPKTEYDELHLTIDWMYPNKSGADDSDYSMNEVNMEMEKDDYEEFWEGKDTDDLEARLEDFEDAGGARPAVIRNEIIPLTGNLNRHDALGEYIDLNGVEVKIDEITTTDSVNGEEAGEGDYEDSSQFIEYEVSIKNNRDYKLRIDIPHAMVINQYWDDSVSNEGVFVEQEEGLLSPGKEHTFTAVSTYEDDVEHDGLEISAYDMDAYEGDEELLDDVPVATWSIEEEIE